MSLPLLSAKYISASYAQPGLIAEGYANFGVVGAVINMLIPFAIAEGSLTYFLKKRNVLHFVFYLFHIPNCYLMVVRLII